MSYVSCLWDASSLCLLRLDLDWNHWTNYENEDGSLNNVTSLGALHQPKRPTTPGSRSLEYRDPWLSKDSPRPTTLSTNANANGVSAWSLPIAKEADTQGKELTSALLFDSGNQAQADLLTISSSTRSTRLDPEMPKPSPNSRATKYNCEEDGCNAKLFTRQSELT
jgi:hypothetical protein